VAHTHPCWGIWHLCHLVGASFPVLNGAGQSHFAGAKLFRIFKDAIAASIARVDDSRSATCALAAAVQGGEVAEGTGTSLPGRTVVVGVGRDGMNDEAVVITGEDGEDNELPCVMCGSAPFTLTRGWLHERTFKPVSRPFPLRVSSQAKFVELSSKAFMAFPRFM
jgi:hypothetical protein